MVIRQQAQDAPVVLGHDAAQPLRPQRRDGRGQGVVGVVFWDLPELRTRTRAANVGGTSTTSSPAADELLGQQEPESVGRLDGPPSLRKVDRPLEEVLDLMTVCLHRQLAECRLLCVPRPPPQCGWPCGGRYRSVPSCSSLSLVGATSGNPDETGVLASFEPRRGRGTRRLTLRYLRPTRRRQGVTEPGRRAPETLEPKLGVATIMNQGDMSGHRGNPGCPRAPLRSGRDGRL